MEIKFYGNVPPNIVQNIRLGGICPFCKMGSRFTIGTLPNSGVLLSDRIKTFVISYSCDHCLEAIPIKWQIQEWIQNQPVVSYPVVVLPSKDLFDFSYVPSPVKKEIDEALDCLSVNAYNGFAAVCRRSIQAICVDLGSDASTKVKSQVEEMIEATGLGDEWKELAVQIMLSGHDGSHPHLPDVSQDRAAILLSLLRDLTYQLYTRPGNIKQAAQLRQAAIDAKKS